MKRFEYIRWCLRYNQDEFDKLGERGWELVIYHDGDFIFKRELPSKGWIPTEQVRKMLNEEDKL